MALKASNLGLTPLIASAMKVFNLTTGTKCIVFQRCFHTWEPSLLTACLILICILWKQNTNFSLPYLKTKILFWRLIKNFLKFPSLFCTWVSNRYFVHSECKLPNGYHTIKRISLSLHKLSCTDSSSDDAQQNSVPDYALVYPPNSRTDIASNLILYNTIPSMLHLIKYMKTYKKQAQNLCIGV